MTGVYLGIQPYQDSFDREGDPCTSQECLIEVRESTGSSGIGRKFALHLHYYGWKVLESELAMDPTCTGSGSDLCDDYKNGRVPVISWECDRTAPPEEQGNSTDEVIADGALSDAGKIDCANPSPGWQYDYCTIKNTADSFKSYPGPVLLRWFWEFNVLAKTQDRVCRGHGSRTSPPTSETYSNFRGAWRKIWEIFAAEKVNNVMFLWNPGNYAPCQPGQSQPCGFKDPQSYYPGNPYVDWIGLDTYQRHAGETFADNFGEHFYGDFKGFGKPLMVGENGSPNYTQANIEQQGAYLGANPNGLLADFQSNMYPELKAYDYFDSDNFDKGKKRTYSWVLDPPATYELSSISASGKTVTVTLSSASGVTTGESITIAGVTPATYDGQDFLATSSSSDGTVLQYEDDALKLEKKGKDGILETTVCEPWCKGVTALTALGDSPKFNAIPRTYAMMPESGMICMVSPKFAGVTADTATIKVDTSSPVGDPALAANCPWTVGPLPSWLTLTSPVKGQGIGPGTVVLFVPAPKIPLRQATIEIGGAFVTVTVSAQF